MSMIISQLGLVLLQARQLLHPVPSQRHWTPYLGETLDSGMATLLAAETIEAIRFSYKLQPEPLPGLELAGGTAYGNLEIAGGDGHLNGPIDDIQLRSWGIQLVDGRMPGFAAIVGAAKSNEVAVKLVRELQKRNILTFLSGNVNGRSIIQQLMEEGVELGYDTYTVPFGTDTISAIYALGFAAENFKKAYSAGAGRPFGGEGDDEWLKRAVDAKVISPEKGISLRQHSKRRAEEIERHRLLTIAIDRGDPMGLVGYTPREQQEGFDLWAGRLMQGATDDKTNVAAGNRIDSQGRELNLMSSQHKAMFDTASPLRPAQFHEASKWYDVLRTIDPAYAASHVNSKQAAVFDVYSTALFILTLVSCIKGWGAGALPGITLGVPRKSTAKSTPPVLMK